MAIKFQQQIVPKEENKSSKSFDLNALLQKEIQFGKSKFNDKKKASFYDELSVLLESGIHLKNALELLVNSQSKIFEKQIFQNLLNDLVEGGTLSLSMKKEKSFTKYEYYAIQIGEETGSLQKITRQLSDFYQRKVQQRSEIIGALTYPVIVLLTALVVVGFMLNFVVPLFVDIFKQNNVDLPVITQFIVTASAFLKRYSLVILGGIVFGIYMIYRLRKNKEIMRFWQKMILKLPIINNYVKNVKLAQFTQAVSLMSNAKIDITKCLSMGANMILFYPLADALIAIEERIMKGEKVSEAFGEYEYLFNKKMIALLKVAEETNNTAYIFEKLHQQFDFEVKRQSKLIGDVLNPILTIIVGLLVGIILIAMYLPMFRLSSIIG